VPVAHFKVGRSAIKVPVSNTIAHCKTFEVGLENAVIFCVLCVVQVDVVGHVGHVYSSVRFTGEVEVIVLELRKLLEESENYIKVILASSVIGESAVFHVICVTVAESNTCWLLDVKYICLSVPAVVTFDDLINFRDTSWNRERTILLHESEH